MVVGVVGVSAIERIEITHHRLPLDPPFPAAWDPQPRAAFPATIVRVVDDAGRVGVGSGDAMYGFADYERWFIGEDPLDLDRHHAVLANIDFHAGRPWPLDVALWDLAGQILDRPVWDLVGGRSAAVRTYASSGVHRPIDEMGALATSCVGARLSRAEGALRTATISPTTSPPCAPRATPSDRRWR